MNRWSRSAFAFAVLLGLTFAWTGEARAGRVVSSEADTLTTADDLAADNTFAINLYERLARPAATQPGDAAASTAGNLFFSPYSVRTVLVMAYTGAGGTTAQQMASVLHLPTTTPPSLVPAMFSPLDQALNRGGSNYALSVAEAMWAQSGYHFQSAFLQTLHGSYGPVLKQANFIDAAEAARQQINDWAEHQTHGKVKDLLPAESLSGYTRLVLTNAIYFKGQWLNAFDNGGTQPEPFHLNLTDHAPVPMMHYYRQQLAYAETAQTQIVELPYRGNTLSMLLLVPKAIDGLPAVDHALTAGALAHACKQMRMRPVAIRMPKFTFNTDVAMGATLKSMGLIEAFDQNRADFSGMISLDQMRRERIYVSDVYHKAFIAVDEQGTEAAAASGAVDDAQMSSSAAPPPDDRVFVNADRPFLFFIRHRPSGAILFVGRVTDPRGLDQPLPTGARALH